MSTSLTPISDVFYPYPLSRFMKHVNDQEGRDKLAKFVAYFSKFMMYHLLNNDKKSDLGLRLKILSNIISNARKLARIFKYFNEYQKLLLSLDSSDPISKQSLEVFNKFTMGWYWFFDNISWLAKGKVLKYDEKSVSYYAGLGWYAGTSSSTVISLIKLFEGYQKEAKLNKIILANKSEEEVKKAQTDLKKILDGRLAVILGAIKNASDSICAGNTIDVWSTLLGYKLNDGVIGVVGCTSAAIASYLIYTGAK